MVIRNLNQRILCPYKSYNAYLVNLDVEFRVSSVNKSVDGKEFEFFFIPFQILIFLQTFREV